MTTSILIVEDDDIDCEMLARMLKKERYDANLYIATDGDSALKMLRADGVEGIPHPRFVVLDIVLPGMDGIEFLMKLRSDAKLSETTVAIHSNRPIAWDHEQVKKLNVAAHIQKSFGTKSYDQLSEVLGKHAAKKRTLKMRKLALTREAVKD